MKKVAFWMPSIISAHWKRLMRCQDTFLGVILIIVVDDGCRCRSVSVRVDLALMLSVCWEISLRLI